MMKKIIKSTVLIGIGILTGICVNNLCLKNELKEINKKRCKFERYFYIMEKWLNLQERQKTLEEFFIINEYKTIAIYGLGILGKHLLEDLKDSSIKISYIIDKNPSVKMENISVLNLDTELEEVDLVVVTPFLDFEDIEMFLIDKINCPIISLEDIVYDID